MQLHYDKLQLQKSGEKWLATIIQKLWTIIYRPRWTNRNEFVRNLHEEAEASRTRENLQSEVRMLYFSEGSAPFRPPTGRYTQRIRRSPSCVDWEL